MDQRTTWGNALVSVRVFVEGGGDQNRTKTACRKAFHVFFEKLLGNRPKPRIIASGSRDQAYRDFSRSLSDGLDDLLRAVGRLGGSCSRWKDSRATLARPRPLDQPAPGRASAPDGSMHGSLVPVGQSNARRVLWTGVQTQSALPQNPHIEEIPKADVFAGWNELRQRRTRELTIRHSMGSKFLRASILI